MNVLKIIVSAEIRFMVSFKRVSHEFYSSLRYLNRCRTHFINLTIKTLHCNRKNFQILMIKLVIVNTIMLKVLCT